MLKINGIHHISSIVGHAQRNVDFYAGVLGMRLVKKTINFDDSSTYHFYYGNEEGGPNLVTTFPWNDANDGEIGAGQVGVATYGVNEGTLDFWKERFDKFSIENFIYKKFNQKRLAFKDPDGLQLELIEMNSGENNKWEFNGVKENEAIKGVSSVNLFSRLPVETLKLLVNIFKYKIVDEDDESYLLEVNDNFSGTIELSKKETINGQMGVGMVHHIALSVNDNEIDAWRDKLILNGFRPTEVKERKYFRSIYFREKGGVLIELATVGPGVLVDESVEDLGTNLMIPPNFESITEEIEETMMPIEVREVDELVGYGYRDRYEFDILRKKEKIKAEILQLKVLQHENKLNLEQVERLDQLKKDLRNVK